MAAKQYVVRGCKPSVLVEPRKEWKLPESIGGKVILPSVALHIGPRKRTGPPTVTLTLQQARELAEHLRDAIRTLRSRGRKRRRVQRASS